MWKTSTGGEEFTVLSCMLCLNDLNVPKQLECLHNFCEKCLAKHINISASAEKEDGKGTFPCPVCRITTRVPNPSEKRKEWAAQMITNNLITSLVNGAPLNKETQLCSPCKREGTTKSALHWCHDCFEPLCDACKAIHKKIRQINSHNILELDEISKRPLSQRMSENTSNSFCGAHPGRQIELFCSHHKKLCCVVCFASEHKECHDINTVEDLADAMKDTGELVEIVDAITELVSKAEEQSADKLQNWNLLNFKHEELIEKINSSTRSAIRRLEGLRNDTIHIFETLHAKESQLIQDQRVILQSSKTALDLNLKYLEAVTKHGSSKDLYITSEKLRQQLEFHREILRVDHEEHEDIDYKFQFNEQFEAIISSLGSIGKLDVLRLQKRENKTLFSGYETNKKSIMPEEQTKRQTQVTNTETLETTKAANIKMKKEKDYDGSSVSDRKIVWFTGGTFCLADGHFIMADYNNHKLKWFKRNVRNSVMEYDVDSAPCDITLVENDEILVSLPHVCRINRYKLLSDGVLKQINAITTFASPEGLTYMGYKLIVSFSKCLKILEDDGQELVTIPTKESFTYTTPVAKTKRALSFVHRDGKAIVCRSLDGDEIFRFQNRELREPSGISVDLHDNIYVCDCRSNTIYQIFSDGFQGRVIRSSRLCVGSPVGIGFDEVGKCLWLTSSIRRSGQLLTVYSLSS